MSAPKCVTIGLATLYLGDCMDVLRSLDAASVDALITDPPYSSGGLMRSDRVNASAVSKYVQNGSEALAHNVDFTGDNRDQRSWGFWLTWWMSQARRIVRPGGYVMSFADWRQLSTMADAFQAGGLIWRGLIPWDKTEAARGPHKGYFKHQAEYVVWGSNGRLPAAQHGGPWPGVIRQRVDHRKKLHMTAKPVEVMAALVAAVPPGGVIIDPFMGSASTGIAALEAGRRFIGCEISEHYFDVACERIRKASADMGLAA